MAFANDAYGFRPHTERLDLIQWHKTCLRGIVTRDGLPARPPREIIMQPVVKALEIGVENRDLRQQFRIDRGFLSQFAQGRLGFGFAGVYPPAGDGPFPLTRGCAALDEQHAIALQADNTHTIGSFNDSHDIPIRASSPYSDPMCGRYTLAGSLDDIATRFGAKTRSEGLWEWEPKYNISPASVIPAIAFNGQGERSVVPMRWGLHPSWRKEPPEGRPLFNARVETAKEKPSFRTPYRRRRALIPTTGWYEWERVEMPNGKERKVPHFIFEDSDESGREIFALAGLWDYWRVDEGIELLSCTVLTTAAQGGIKHLHHRMPVRLPETMWDCWLDADTNPDRTLETMLGAEDLGYYEVDRAVGNARNDGPELIRPAVEV